jgi:protein SCO1/2
MPTRGHLIIALALAFAAGVAGFLAARHGAAPPPAVEGLLWPDPRTVGPFEAVDQDGQPFSEARLRGHWSLLFFGFTNCPDICPMTLSALAQARGALADAAAGTPLQVVFVSVDPVRDTPAQLAGYVRYFDPTFVGVGGTPEQVRGLTAQLGVAFMYGEPGSDGGYTVDHSAAVFVIDPAGRFVGVLSAPHQPDALVSRFRGIAEFIHEAGS